MASFDLSQLPTSSDLTVTAGPVVGLRWNDGVLEQGVQTIVYENGVPVKSEIKWSRVPIHR